VTMLVGATIPEDTMAHAAYGLLGSRFDQASRSGLVRAALALYKGANRDQAISYAQRTARLGSEGQDYVTAKVPDELAQVDCERAYAIRVGLAMAGGLSRKQAESYARNMVRPAHRPARQKAA